MTDRSDFPDFDPEARLPGPPEPWVPSTMPAVRDGPPYALTEMIAAEPAFAERLVDRLGGDRALARLVLGIRSAADSSGRIVITGCGTSEHGALGVADILR